MRKRTQARECALQILYQLDVIKLPVDQVLAAYWELHPAPEEVVAFAERLVCGTHDEITRIDQIIERYAENWQLHRMAVVDRNILRFAVFELLFMDEIPPKVTINEAVNIAKKYSQDEAGKFVNGVLDKINHTEAPPSKAITQPEEPKDDSAD